MNRKSYIPPSIHILRLQNVSLMLVNSVRSADVQWSSQGFNDTDEDR